MEFQIRNLLAFIGIIDTIDGPVSLHLTTSAEDDYQKRTVSQKFDEIASNLEPNGITFTYEFNDTIHRRGIDFDNGWKIILDRGLDFYQKPESKYELSEIDQQRGNVARQRLCLLRNNDRS